MSGVPFDDGSVQEVLRQEFQDAIKTGHVGPTMRRVAQGEALIVTFHFCHLETSSCWLNTVHVSDTQAKCMTNVKSNLPSSPCWGKS